MLKARLVADLMFQVHMCVSVERARSCSAEKKNLLSQISERKDRRKKQEVRRKVQAKIINTSEIHCVDWS